MPHLLDAPARTEPSSKAGQKHYKVAEKDLPDNRFQARIIDNLADLEYLREAWQRLAEVTLRPNPFLDPDFLIPAVQHLGKGKVKVLVVEAHPRVWPEGPAVLCALMPLVERRFYHLPLSCYELWKHDQCFDATPLLRRDCSAEVLAHVFRFLGQEVGTSLLSLDTVAGEGEFQQLLTDCLYQSGNTVFHRQAFTRACFVPACDAENYIMAEVSKNTRKGTTRLERKLMEQGELRVREWNATESTDRWIKEFLELESSGWKGRGGTSLASSPLSHQFFADLASRSLPAGKMSLLKIEFNGQPIAMLCDLHQGTHAAAFKMAIDEAFATYTPGVIAVLKNIERLHRAGVTVMDSCADPNHSMINRVWSGRVRYQSCVIALRGWGSRLATAAMPLLQTVHHLAKNRHPGDIA